MSNNRQIHPSLLHYFRNGLGQVQLSFLFLNIPDVPSHLYAQLSGLCNTLFQAVSSNASMRESEFYRTVFVSGVKLIRHTSTSLLGGGYVKEL